MAAPHTVAEPREEPRHMEFLDELLVVFIHEGFEYVDWVVVTQSTGRVHVSNVLSQTHCAVYAMMTRNNTTGQDMT